MLATPLLLGATCGANRGKEKEQAMIHYDLGVQAMQDNDARGALSEMMKSVEFDPNLDVAHNALGLLYHLSFGRPDRAVEHYRKALQLNPRFSEASNNLANVYLAQGRCSEAIPLYEQALSDILYRTPYVAENNLGWCYYKEGDVRTGIDHIRSALMVNNRFCMGHRNLGIIYGDTGDVARAKESFARFARVCPDEAAVDWRYAVQLLRDGDHEGAQKVLAGCARESRDQTQADECRRQLELLERH